MWYTLLQCSAVQCSGVHYQAEQYSNGKLSELHYSWVQYYGGYFDFFLQEVQVLYDLLSHSTMQYSAVP